MVGSLRINYTPTNPIGNLSVDALPGSMEISLRLITGSWEKVVKGSNP
jgi:hypothetical protein